MEQFRPQSESGETVVDRLYVRLGVTGFAWAVVLLFHFTALVKVRLHDTAQRG